MFLRVVIALFGVLSPSQLQASAQILPRFVWECSHFTARKPRVTFFTLRVRDCFTRGGYWHESRIKLASDEFSGQRLQPHMPDGIWL